MGNLHFVAFVRFRGLALAVFALVLCLFRPAVSCAVASEPLTYAGPQAQGNMLAVSPRAVSPPAGEVASEAGSEENGWNALIAGHPLTPLRLVAVDKARQMLYLFERRSPLRLARQYVCTTGQVVGDKYVTGDLKTPEGIYFVVRRLDSGLDYLKYGNEAYTLNYPNPVDRLRNKTGYGIWIHGRGTPIEPRITEGCVSLNNGDIAVLGKNLAPGTPVALASRVQYTPSAPEPDAAMVAALERKAHGWAKAWSSRSKTMFDFYNPEAYSRAQGESFSAFQAQKERLFKQLAWIDTTISDVQVMQGPGYWVTWFFQDYKASNLSTKGVRRLYWQPDSTGEMRIVGMEWLPHLEGILVAGLEGVPIAEGSAEALAATELALRPDAASLEQAARAAETPLLESASASSAAAPEQTAPASAPETPSASEVPLTELPEPAETDLALVEPHAEPVVQPAAPLRNPSEELASQGARFIEEWRKAWENGDLAAYIACYDKDARQGGRWSAAAIERHKRTNWKKKPPNKVALSNVRISVRGDTITADMHQEYSDVSGYGDVGLKILVIKRFGEALRIIEEDWSAESL